MRGNLVHQRRVAVTALAMALILLFVGSLRSHKVYDKDSRDVGVLTFQMISDPQLVADATFTGVVRRDEKLYATYDRSQGRGRQACPS